MHAGAHITGGGLPGNLPGSCPRTWTPCWSTPRDVPRIFAEIQRAGAVDDAEMDRVFNAA